MTDRASAGSVSPQPAAATARPRPGRAVPAEPAVAVPVLGAAIRVPASKQAATVAARAVANGPARPVATARVAAVTEAATTRETAAPTARAGTGIRVRHRVRTPASAAAHPDV